MKKLLYPFAAFALTALAVTSMRTYRIDALNFSASSYSSEPFNQKFTVDGVDRMALIFPGSAQTPKNGSPMVFVFHGHGGTARFAALRFKIHIHWPEAVVAYMQGLPTVTGRDPQGGRPGWQNSPGLHGNRDLKFFDATVGWAKQKYKIDDTRIYAAGHSNGGGMTYALWSARSEVIAAFAPSAAVFGYKARMASPKPALLIVGESDNIVPTANQERNVGAVLLLNQCEPTGKELGTGIKHYQSKVGADTTVYIHSGGHKMPDDAGEVIVKFFKQHRLR